MTRLGSMISCTALGLGAVLSGCGGGGSSGGGGGASSALDLILASNAVGGWAFDNSDSHLTNGPATATTEAATGALIDGASADFFAAPSTPVQFAWMNYLNTSISTADTTSGAPDQYFPKGATLTLYVLQMPNATQVSGLYSSLLSASLYVGKTWTEPSLSRGRNRFSYRQHGGSLVDQFLQGQLLRRGERRSIVQPSARLHATGKRGHQGGGIRLRLGGCGEDLISPHRVGLVSGAAIDGGAPIDGRGAIRRQGDQGVVLGPDA